MAQTTVVLVRHPETVANIDGIFVGRGDSPYTPQGLRELRRARRRIRSFEPDGVWSSPLRRALSLASSAARDCGVALTVDDDLQELDFGVVEHMTFDQVQLAGLGLDYASWDSPVAKGGESRADIAHRTGRALERIVSSGGTQVVVTHGGVVRAALVQLLGLSHEAIWAFHIHNVQIAVVRVIEGHGMLEEYRKA